VTDEEGPSGHGAPAPDPVSASTRLEAEMATLGSLAVATDRARTPAEVAATALDILGRATGADGGLVTSTDRIYEATAHRGVRQETIDVILAYGQLGGPLATPSDTSLTLSEDTF